METKVCPRCGERKIVARFNKNSSNKDGLQAYCRDCQSVYHHMLYKRNMQDPEYVERSNVKDKQRYWNKRKYDHKALEKHAKRRREWKSKATTNLRMFILRLEKEYGTTVEHIQDLLDKQKGQCVFCGFDFGQEGNGRGKWRSYHIDHCHETGRIRGLLCGTCNIRLGVYENYIKPNICSINSYLGGST